MYILLNVQAIGCMSVVELAPLGKYMTLKLMVPDILQVVIPPPAATTVIFVMLRVEALKSCIRVESCLSPFAL